MLHKKSKCKQQQQSEPTYLSKGFWYISSTMHIWQSSIVLNMKLSLNSVYIDETKLPATKSPPKPSLNGRKHEASKRLIKIGQQIGYCNRFQVGQTETPHLFIHFTYFAPKNEASSHQNCYWLPLCVKNETKSNEYEEEMEVLRERLRYQAIQQRAHQILQSINELGLYCVLPFLSRLFYWQQ